MPVWSRPVATAKTRSRPVNSFKLKSLREAAISAPLRACGNRCCAIKFLKILAVVLTSEVSRVVDPYRMKRGGDHGLLVPNTKFIFVRTMDGEVVMHQCYRHPVLTQGRPVLTQARRTSTMESWTGGATAQATTAPTPTTPSRHACRWKDFSAMSRSLRVRISCWQFQCIPVHGVADETGSCIPLLSVCQNNAVPLYQCQER